MKIVYIAGPYRAGNSWEIEQNIRRAEELALEVWRLNAVAYCPHTMTRFYQGALPDKVWLDGGSCFVRRCDALLTVFGWGSSEGACTEVSEAKRVGVPVFHNIGSLKDWLNGNK